MLLTLPIREVVPAGPRARILRLGLDGNRFDYSAGQAVAIATAGSTKRRPYSIASAPEDTSQAGHLELLIGVDAEGRPGPHLSLEPGTLVDVEGPAGSFTFPDAPIERSFVFVAGGTGIAPLRSMLRHAIRATPPPKHVGLLYSVRTPDDFAFADEFRALATAGRIDFRQRVTREAASEWSGARGRIDRQALAELIDGPDTLCFVCGPMAMVDEMPKLLVELGVPREKIRIEEW